MQSENPQSPPFFSTAEKVDNEMYQEVIEFWFREIDEKMWWKKDPEFDRLIKTRFGELHGKASAGELFRWRDDALGSLAEVIVLDQFSRNMFRGQPKSFAFDNVALVLAQNAISKGFHMELPEVQRAFLYMPLMHSESPSIHIEAVKLFQELGNPRSLDFELKHKAIIDRFGRYPHRNEIMGRASTAEEDEFLKQPNSSF